MLRLRSLFFRALFLAVLINAGLLSARVFLKGAPLAQAAPAVTNVCGTLAVDTTWLLSASPYQVCGAGVTVPSGKMLVIEAGVTVQFDAVAGNKLNVQGALFAIGTPTQTITLTGVSASPGSWGGIYANGTLIAPAAVLLDYTSLNYGGLSGSYGAQVYADQAQVTITHSLVSNSAGNGIYTSSKTVFEAHSTEFVGNSQNAIQLNQPSTSLIFTDLTASGNGTNGVRVVGSSTFEGVQRWTSPGIPYIVDGPISTNAGDELTIEPGNTLEFTSQGWLYIRGRLKAVGLPGQPILLTAQNQTPGGWKGLFLDGIGYGAGAELDYVIIEYAGSGTHGANIEVANGRLNVRNSIIRNSQKDGVRFDNNWGGSILESQVIDNALHGIFNQTPQRPVLATNNWWGDPEGPQSDVVGCSTGLGSKVSSGVIFNPVFSSDTTTTTLPLSDMPHITLTPRRWFATANGLTRIYFDLVLYDGNGTPMPGRTVNLNTSLGTAVNGGATDQSGKTLAYVVSLNSGDAVISASLVPISPCEMAMPPDARVTFTPPDGSIDLLPNAPSSYFDGDIEITPMPVIKDVPTTITVTLTNPLANPITVNVSFGYAQSGIGLVFGPIDDIVGQVIPAGSTVKVSTTFLPPMSGHWCFEVTYEITSVGSALLALPARSGSGGRRMNLNVFPGSMGSSSSKDSLAKADNAFKIVSKIPAGPTMIQKGILSYGWGLAKDTVSEISRALGFDPPRQDYNVVTLPVWHTIPPVQPDVDISEARASAMNAVSTALVDIEAYGTAATTALDRSAGAAEAKNMYWYSEQANAQLYYQEKLGTALLLYADALDAFVLVLNNEGETEVIVSVSDVISYQQRLSTEGFNSAETAEATLLGWSAADIEAYRLGIIAAKPEEVAGNLLVKFSNEALVSRKLGNDLLYPQIFDSGLSISGSSGRAGIQAAPQAGSASLGNSMAQIYNSEMEIQLGNPLGQSALIDLNLRRIDLPADWSMSVSPAQVTLEPGEQTTVTVRIIAGSPVPQGYIPRVAVEGYTGGELLGGVVFDLVIPAYMPFGSFRVFLPLIAR